MVLLALEIYEPAVIVDRSYLRLMSETLCYWRSMGCFYPGVGGRKGRPMDIEMSSRHNWGVVLAFHAIKFAPYRCGAFFVTLRALAVKYFRYGQHISISGFGTFECLPIALRILPFSTDAEEISGTSEPWN
jgi:hypothetical protein